MQFVYTVSSFLHIMIRHNVDFCKNEPLFIPLIIFHLNCILLLMMKMNKKQFLFHSWKIRAEGRIPLSYMETKLIDKKSFSLLISKGSMSHNGGVLFPHKEIVFSSPEIKVQGSFSDPLLFALLFAWKFFTFFNLCFKYTEPISNKS